MLTTSAAPPLPFRARSQENGGRGTGGGAFQRAGLRSGMEGERDRLLGELYAELRARAERCLRGQPPGLTLQTTALVHEACLRLFGRERLESEDRGHLLALASTAMRSVLVDHARTRNRVKRTAPGQRVPLDGISVAYEDRAVDLLALDEALERLGRFDPPMARAVELHFFGGLSLEETARMLALPQRSFDRRWAATRAWLRAEIG